MFVHHMWIVLYICKCRNKTCFIKTCFIICRCSLCTWCQYMLIPKSCAQKKYLNMDRTSIDLSRWLSKVMIRTSTVNSLYLYRVLQRTSPKLLNAWSHLLFTETCSNNKLVPHHTNIYKYIYVYIYKYMYIYKLVV